MEALVLIFGDLVFALLAPIFLAIVELVAAVFGFGFSMIPSGNAPRWRAPALLRKGAAFLTILAVLIVGAVWVVDRYYFAPSVRFLFGTMESRMGIEASCDGIEGSVFKGQVNLSDCDLRRLNDESLTFDLRVNELSLDVAMTSVLSTAVVEEAQVQGLKGWVRRDETSNTGDDSALKANKPARAFIVQDLVVDTVELSLAGRNGDGERFEIPIIINSIHSAPFRSRLALFDVLFRSNASGTIAGASFELATSMIDGGRETTWRADKVPVADFGRMVGGALAWFEKGTVDLSVVDRWRTDESLELDMDWRLNFDGVHVAAPKDSGVLKRALSQPLLAYVNDQGGQFPLEFQMVVNEDQFEYQSSLAAAGLWGAVGKSVNTGLKAIGVEINVDGEGTGDKLKEGAKSVLDRLRKRKTDNAEGK